MTRTARLVAAATAAVVGCGSATLGAPGTTEPLDEASISCVESVEAIHGELTDVEAGLYRPKEGATPDVYAHVRAHLATAEGYAAELSSTHPNGDVRVAATHLHRTLAALAADLDDRGPVIASAPTTVPGDTPTPGVTSRGQMIADAVSDARSAVEDTYHACPGTPEGP